MTPARHAPMHRRPLWLGALLAPLAAPFALLALILGWDFASGERSLSFVAAVEILAFALVLGLPIAICATWLLGLPLAAWLRRRGSLSLRSLCIAAAPLGAFAFVAGMAAFGARLALAAQLAAGAFIGVAVALTFGLVSGLAWRR